MVAALLIAAAIVDEPDAGGYGARRAWLYVTIPTVGYLVSRGLAKSGTRDPYTASINSRSASARLASRRRRVLRQNGKRTDEIGSFSEASHDPQQISSCVPSHTLACTERYGPSPLSRRPGRLGSPPLPVARLCELRS